MAKTSTARGPRNADKLAQIFLHWSANIPGGEERSAERRNVRWTFRMTNGAEPQKVTGGRAPVAQGSNISTIGGQISITVSAQS